ncbi:GDP-fucose synthetase [Salmonella enterica subsp. enterica serovar Typhimurium]|nr:GDP-fucose synthetase [Salmonella enterica subsp. enterica serovar Typhimurium]
MNKQRIFVAGHRGMVGSAIVRQLAQRGDVELVLRTRDELDLLDGRAVQAFFAGRVSTRFIWRRRKWAALSPTTRIRRILFMKT